MRQFPAVPVAVGLFVVALGVSRPTGAQDFVLGGQGCPMAHCDVRMSDLANLPAPGANVGVVWRREADRGSLSGLGCSSNGTVVACTLIGTGGDNLVVYDYDGNRLWGSGSVLNETTPTSAPIVAVDGSVIVADDLHVVRFDPQGTVVWNTPTPGGNPISPVLTDNGHVVLASFAGPISAYDLATGALVGALPIRKFGLFGPTFSTTNTPCVRGNRVYVLVEKDGANLSNEGRLVAVDVSASGLRLAWQVGYGARSATSPLAIGDTIYFVGDRPAGGFGMKEPTVIAVRDLGNQGEVVWTRPVQPPFSVLAAMAQDPRGGMWFFPAGDENLIRLDAGDGHEIERIGVDALVGEPAFHVPGSAITIAGTAANPVLLVSAKSFRGTSYVLAVDLAARTLLWKALVSAQSALNHGSTSGQFPVMTRNGSPRVVYSTYDLGVFAVGENP